MVYFVGSLSQHKYMDESFPYTKGVIGALEYKKVTQSNIRSSLLCH